MKKSILTGTFIIVLVVLFLAGCGNNKVEPTAADLPTELPPTVTLAPTKALEPQATLTPTNLPQPTQIPTVAPIRLFLSDVERIAAVYPESVEIVQAVETAYLPNAAMGIAFRAPVFYAFQLKSDPQVGAWEWIGGGLKDNRLLSLSIGLLPIENSPSIAEIESWNNPNPAGSLKTSEEIYDFENGFGVLFTELYSHRGHYGIDVVYTLVLDYDDQYSIGIGYFLSEEIYNQEEIDEKLDSGIAFVQEMQMSYSQFDAIEGVQGTNEYRILTGVCPTDTDETYGYTQENPISMAAVFVDPVAAALMGPGSVSQFFETLLYEDQPISFTRVGSITTEETILDEYQVTRSDGETVILYVDQYSSAPYRVPVGFDCAGILNPEYLFGFED